MFDFVCVDVETADSWVGSICQIGIAESAGGQLLRRELLVNPQRPFLPVNTSIHGLAAGNVADAPMLADYHEMLFGLFHRKIVASYTAFDLSAFMSAFHAEGMALPDPIWIDACAVARDAWPKLASHKLRVVGANLGINFSTAHQAGQDALAAAYVLLKGLRLLGLTVEQAIARYQIREVSVIEPPPISGDRQHWSEILLDHAGLPSSLEDQVVVLTGDLPFERGEMATRIEALGGIVKSSVTSKTTLIVSGWTTPAAGGQKLKNAVDRILDGQPILYCGGAEFLTWIATQC